MTVQSVYTPYDICFCSRTENFALRLYFNMFVLENLILKRYTERKLKSIFPRPTPPPNSTRSHTSFTPRNTTPCSYTNSSIAIRRVEIEKLQNGQTRLGNTTVYFND